MSYILEALRKVEQQRENLPARGLSSRRRYPTVVSAVMPRPKTLIIVVAALAGASISGFFSVYLTAANKNILVGAQAVVQPMSSASGLTQKPRILSTHENKHNVIENDEVKPSTIPESPLHAQESRDAIPNREKAAREKQQEVAIASRDDRERSVGTSTRRFAHSKRQHSEDSKAGNRPPHSVGESHSGKNELSGSPAMKESTTHEEPELLSALSPQLQGMPEIKIDGVIYSSDPGKSVVIINTKLYTEGQTTPDGITVEAIRPGGVICSYHGQRFRLSR